MDCRGVAKPRYSRPGVGGNSVLDERAGVILLRLLRFERVMMGCERGALGVGEGGGGV